MIAEMKSFMTARMPSEKKLTDIILKDNDRQFHNYLTNYLFQRLQVCT